MLGSKKYCCLQRIALPEAATHVASVGDRSAVNFMLKLSCFYFCKWLLPIQDVEIRQCTVTACSTTPVYCHSMQHTTSVLSQHAAHHQCTVTACSTTRRFQRAQYERCRQLLERDRLICRATVFCHRT